MKFCVKSKTDFSLFATRSFKDHLQSSQKELLADVGKGKMTPEIDAKLKKTVVE
jgi:F-type H+-transporting ATPase subunit alpha